MKKIIAVIPTAKNSCAEAIRDRTRCAICGNRIENGQEIYDLEDSKGTLVHCTCHWQELQPAIV